MPTLIRQEGFAIRIPTHDHDPPHVHCWRGAVEIIVNLDASTTVREVNGPAKVGISETRNGSSPNIDKHFWMPGDSFMAKRPITGSTKTVGPTVYTYAELRMMSLEARRRGRERMKSQPLATAVACDPDRKIVTLVINNGCQVLIPLSEFPELRRGNKETLRNVNVMGQGQSIEWPILDMQFEVPELLARIFGTRALFAMEAEERSRHANSTATVAVSRRNGSKGGRSQKLTSRT